MSPPDAIDGGKFRPPGEIVGFQSTVDAGGMHLTRRAGYVERAIDQLDFVQPRGRGTVRLYSTLAGLLCEPQLKVRSWSGYLVRIER